MEIKLERMDWEQVKQAAENNLRRALIDEAVWTPIMVMAEKELKKYPPKKEKKPSGVG